MVRDRSVASVSILKLPGEHCQQALLSLTSLIMTLVLEESLVHYCVLWAYEILQPEHFRFTVQAYLMSKSSEIRIHAALWKDGDFHGVRESLHLLKSFFFKADMINSRLIPFNTWSTLPFQPVPVPDNSSPKHNPVQYQNSSCHLNPANKRKLRGGGEIT